MFGKCTLIILGLLALTSIALADKTQEDPEPPGNFINIDSEVVGKESREEVPEESGSGNHGDDEDSDEDMDTGSGSGSGDGSTDTKEPELKTTTSKSLTPCENLREASKHLLGNYVPRCTKTGEYASMQCRGYPGTGRCWCSDKTGVEIPGTAMDPPKTPDCEKGSNLSPCIYKFVQHMRAPMFGSFAPRCKMNGEFEEMQCHGSVCFCVDKYGDQIYNTKKDIGEMMREDCMEKTTTKVVEPPIIIPDNGIKINTGIDKPKPTNPVDPGYTIETKIDHIDKDSEEEGESEEDNKTGDDSDEIPDPEQDPTKMASAHIMTQPGLLAAIIGGAVVGLLCAILLVMFIVYRMRKKDEGSYALDEPSRKKSAYSPINQSDKEYYA